MNVFNEVSEHLSSTVQSFSSISSRQIHRQPSLHANWPDILTECTRGRQVNRCRTNLRWFHGISQSLSVRSVLFTSDEPLGMPFSSRYCLTTEHGPFEWTIYKRYRHFSELHKALVQFVEAETKRSINDFDRSVRNRRTRFPSSCSNNATTTNQPLE